MTYQVLIPSPFGSARCVVVVTYEEALEVARVAKLTAPEPPVIRCVPSGK